METQFFLKDIYSPAFYDTFADALAQVLPALDKALFLQQIFLPAFVDMELKERMRHTAQVLSLHLPADFGQASDILLRFIDHCEAKGMKENSIEYMFLPEYIEKFGLEHYDTAIRTIERVTQFTSCEFAVRPFLIKYEEKMTAQMLAWSKHTHKKVRRLASEGIRPRLPWGIALQGFKQNPKPVLPILENLKQDECEAVRRSVANNLNDISKDNPDTVITIARRWQGISPETDALIKHACRTLLKKAHPDILALYGLDSQALQVSDFQVLTPKVKIGESLEFSFKLTNTSNEEVLTRLEYGLYYLKNNGTLSKKVFKISEKIVAPQESLLVVRKQSFRLITTRVFYAGKHELSIILNGEEKAKEGFVLEE